MAGIAGIGAVGPFGNGRSALREAMARGGCPGPEPLAEGSIALYRADTKALEERLPARALRRMDGLSKMALLGACLALEDATGPVDRSGLGLVVATGYGPTRSTFGFLDTVRENGDPLASPTLFSASVHNGAAGTVSLFLGITGPCLTVSQFHLSFPSAALSALAWLREGRIDACLLVAADEFCDPLGYCWGRLRRPSKGHLEPLTLGEGAVAFLLTGNAAGPRGAIADAGLSVDGSAFPEALSMFVAPPPPAFVPARPLGGTTHGFLYGETPAALGFETAIAAMSPCAPTQAADAGGILCVQQVPCGLGWVRVIPPVDGGS